MAIDSDSDCPPIELEDDTPEILSHRSSSQPVIQFSVWHTFKHHIPRLLITILVDIILPLIIYMILQKHVKPVHAFLTASIPPLLMVTIKGLISRTFDAVAFLVFIAFATSAIAALLTHNPYILLFEKSFITGITSIIFGITLIPFNCCHHRCQIRPLAYYLYRDLVPTKRIHVGLPDILFEDDQELISNEETFLPKLTHKQEVSQVYEWLYAHCSSFRSACYIITSIWAFGLFLEFLIRFVLILIHLSINKVFIYSHIILSLITCLLTILTIICITIERKKTLKLIEKWKNEYLNIQQQFDTTNLII